MVGGSKGIGIIDSTASVFFRIGKDDDVFIRYSRQRIVYGFDTGGTLTPLSSEGLATATMLKCFFMDRKGSWANRLSQAMAASS